MMTVKNQINLKVPPELKVRLEKAAESNRRTLTAECIYRLELSLDEHPVISRKTGADES
jgi:hypothetical protein